MPVTNTEKWQTWKDNNQDAYGGCCVKVAEKAMEMLDKEGGEIDCHDLICRADKEAEAGGITGFMAGAVASMINQCHSRGEEFRKAWNAGYNVTSDEGVVNPAILTLKTNSPKPEKKPDGLDRLIKDIKEKL